mgnify:CR=1 FL=1
MSPTRDFTQDPVPDEMPYLGPPTRLRASRLAPMPRLAARLWLLRQLVSECYAQATPDTVERIRAIHQHIEIAWTLCADEEEEEKETTE